MENNQEPLKNGYKVFSNNSGDHGRNHPKQTDIMSSFTDDQIKDVLGKSGENQPIRISLSQEQISAKLSKDTNKIRSGIPKPEVPPIFRNLTICSKEIEIDSKNDVKSEGNSNSLVKPDTTQESRIPCRNRRLSEFNLISDSSSSDKDTVTVKPCTSNFKRLPVTNLSTRSNVHQSEGTTYNKFVCGLCKSAYKDPRVLDCLHSFCLSCLIHFEMAQSSRLSGKSEESSEVDLSISASTKTPDSTYPNSISITSFAESELHSQKRPIGKLLNRERKNSIKVSRQRSSSIVSNAEKHKTTIQCPVCGYSTEISSGPIHRLPQNFLLNRQMQKARISIKSAGPIIWCDLCSNENLAIAICIQCNMHLCSICKEAHNRQKDTSMHSVSYISDMKFLQSNNDERNGRNRAQKCPIHTSFDLKLFCTNCNQIICTNCTIVLHKNHKHESISRAIKIYSKLVKDNLERTRPLSMYASDSISKLNSISKKINQRAEDVQNEVETFLVQYADALNVHRNILLKQISRAKQTKMQSITDQQIDLEKRSNEAKTAIGFTEEILTNGSELEILTFVGILLRRFEHCQKHKAPLDPKISDHLEFLPEIKAPSTIGQNNIPLYGIIATQVAIPKLCTLNADNLMFLRVHRKTEFCLTTMDIDNRPLCHGGLTIIACLTYKDSNRIVPTQVSDRRDGTYITSFQPDAPGVLILSVTIQDKHIKGSPFTLCARALRPHSGIFHCCTFCSSRGSKMAKCACEGTMPGGYKGCGHGHDGHPGRRHWSCCASDLETSECSATNNFR